MRLPQQGTGMCLESELAEAGCAALLGRFRCVAAEGRFRTGATAGFLESCARDRRTAVRILRLSSAGRILRQVRP